MKLRPVTELLYRRDDPHDPRLGDTAKMPDIREFEKRDWDVAIIGFPDDRGIALNSGRPGAAEGPAAIRRWLYRLVSPNQEVRLADLGDLQMSDSLEADHAMGVEAVALGLSRAKRVVILGGGHDWGFVPIAALAQGGRTGFVNIDAHLDVRPSPVPHSGTSYWRALETKVRGEDALWFGVQTSATARMHLEYSLAKGGRVWNADVLSTIAAAQEVADRCEAVDLSLDMDAIRMAEAPGVSAPQPLGLPADVALTAILAMLGSPKTRTFGIYETSPPHDVQEITARLAARFAWEACR